MGDIWLPGLPPAYTDYAHCLALLAPHMANHQDAIILAAIAGHESGYDWRVINDTPATGDYSVGLWEINYYASLYPSRAAAFGTPRQLVESGPQGQARAALTLYNEAGFQPWEADIIGNVWQQYVGSGPVPSGPSGFTGLPGPVKGILQDGQLWRQAAHQTARELRALAEARNSLTPLGTPGWRP